MSASTAEGVGSTGTRQVHVRAYSRVVNGRVQQVSDYEQTREGEKQADVPGVERETEKSVKPEPAEQGDGPRHVVIFVGGAGDGMFLPVKEFFRRFARDNPDIQVEYFAHDEPGAIRRLIEGLPRGTQMSLVGHSWGGDTAAQVAAALGAEGRRVS